MTQTSSYRAVWRLARIGLRTSTPLRRSSLLIAVAFAALQVVVTCVSAFTLTAEQQADKDLGPFKQQTSTTVLLGDVVPGFLKAASAGVARQAPGSHVSLESTQIRPDSFAKRYVQAPLETLRYLEDPDLRSAAPDRYTIMGGRWPQSPGEVVVSNAIAEALSDPETFTVLSQRATFRVVGTVQDAYVQHGDVMVAAPGTFETIPPASRGRAFQPVEAQLEVRFATATRPAQVEGIAREVVPLLSGRSADNVSLQENLLTRADAAVQPTPAFGSGQLAVSFVPLALVILVATALSAAQLRRSAQTTTARLVSIGVRPRVVLGSHLVAALLATSLAIAAGLTTGWLMALIARAWPLRDIAGQPLSPIVGLSAPSVWLAATTIVMVAIALAWPTGGTTIVARWASQLHLPMLRRTGAAVSAIGAVQIGGGPQSVTASYLALAAVVLLAPDLLRLLVRALPRNSPRPFLAGRLLRTGGPGPGLATIVVACCVALPTCVATQLVSKQASDASFTYSRVPSHQIWVQNSGRGDVTAVADVVAAEPGLDSPVTVRGVAFTGPKSQGAYFTKAPSQGSSNGSIMVVETASDLIKVLGNQAPSAASETVSGGGVLDFTNTAGDQQFLVSTSQGKEVLTTPPLPTLKVTPDRAVRAQFGGAILLDTARELGLPVKPPSTYIFTDTTLNDVEDAVQAAVNAGYDSEFVQYQTPPPPPRLPTYAWAFLGCLLIAAVFVLLVVVRAQARHLRIYTERLVAIGLTPRWTRSVLLIQTGLPLGAGILAGLAAGPIGVLVIADAYAVTDVPAMPILLAGTTILGAGIVTVLLVSSRIRPSDQPALT